MRAPVVAALPAERLRSTSRLAATRWAPASSSSQCACGFRTERERRIEAVEHALPIEEQQPILRTTLRREEQQRQLIGGQQLLLVQAERDLPVALGQMPRQLEDALGADAPAAHARDEAARTCPSLSEFVHRPDHAASRAPSRASPGTGRDAAGSAVDNADETARRRRFAAASSSSSASSATASSYCAAVNGTCLGGSNLISVLFVSSHRGRQRSQTRDRRIRLTYEKADPPRRSLPGAARPVNRENSPYIERPFPGLKSHTRR